MALDLSLYPDLEATPDLSGAPQMAMPQFQTQRVEAQPTQFYQPVEPEEDYTAFERGLYSNIDTTQGALYGAVGAVADLVNKNAEWDALRDISEVIRDWGYDGYKRNMEEAAQYGELTSFGEAFDSPENFFTYVAETIGGLTPSIIGALASGGIGAGATQIVGKAVAKRLGTKAAQKAVRNRIATYALEGMARKEAAQKVFKEIAMEEARVLAKRGALAGTVGYSAGVESGGNWTEDVEAHGIENTAPGQDLMFGILSGMTDLAGGEGSIIRKVLGRGAVSAQAEDAVRKSIAGVLAKNALKGAGQEGIQEGVQEALAIANQNIQDDRELITPDDMERLYSAVAAGSIGGIAFGGIGGTFDARDAYLENKRIEAAKAPMTPEQAGEQAQAAETLAMSVRDKSIQQAESEFQVAVQPLLNERESLKAQFSQATGAGDTEGAKAIQNRILELTGQIATQRNIAKNKSEQADSQAKQMIAKANQNVQTAVVKEAEAMADPIKAKPYIQYPPTELQMNIINTGLDRVDKTTKGALANSDGKLMVLNSEIKQLYKLLETTRAEGGDTEYMNAELQSVRDSIKSIEAARKAETKRNADLRKFGNEAAAAYAHYGTDQEHKIADAWNKLDGLVDSGTAMELEFATSEDQLANLNRHLEKVHAASQRRETRKQQRRAQVAAGERGIARRAREATRTETARERMEDQRRALMSRVATEQRDRIAQKAAATGKVLGAPYDFVGPAPELVGPEFQVTPREEMTARRRALTEQFAEAERQRALREGGVRQAEQIREQQAERLTWSQRKEANRQLAEERVRNAERRAELAERRAQETGASRQASEQAYWDAYAQAKQEAGVAQAEEVAALQANEETFSDRREAKRLQKEMEDLAKQAKKASLAARAAKSAKRKSILNAIKENMNLEAIRAGGSYTANIVANEQATRETFTDRREAKRHQEYLDELARQADITAKAAKEAQKGRRKAITDAYKEYAKLEALRAGGVYQAERVAEARKDRVTATTRREQKRALEAKRVAAKGKRAQAAILRKGKTETAAEASRQAYYDTRAETLREEGISQAEKVAEQQMIATSEKEAKKAAKERKAIQARPFEENRYANTTYAIENTLKRLPVLKEVTEVVKDTEDMRLPRHVAKEAKLRNLTAAYDPRTNKIYLFANNIKSTKQAITVLLHEGIGHFGLFQMFNNEERSYFFESIAKQYGGEKLFKELAKKYPELDAAGIAEEYIAVLAERTRVKDINAALSQDEKTVWRKVKNLVKRLLTRLGFTKISKQNINEVFTASIHFLANKDNIGKMKTIKGPQEVMRVRGSKQYLAFRSKVLPIKGYATKFAKYWNSVNEQTGVAEHGGKETFVEKYMDSMRRVLTVQNSLESVTGKAIVPEANVYTKSENYYNKENAAQQLFHKQFVEPLQKLVGRAVTEVRNAEEVLSQAAKVAYASHAPERNRAIMKATKGKEKIMNGSGMTNEEAAKILAEYSGDTRIMDIVKLIQDMNKWQLNFREENGLIEKDVADKLRGTFQQYVPLKGWEEDQAMYNENYSFTSKGTSFGAGGWKVPTAKGRTELAENPIMHSIRQSQEIITQANKAEIGRAFMKLDEEFPDNGLWTRQKTTAPAGKKVVIKRDKDTGLPYLKIVPRTSALDGKPNVYTVMDENGVPVKFQIHDEALFRTLTGQNMANVGDLQKTLFDKIGKGTRELATLSTYRNPAFVFAGMIRDAITTAFNVPSIKNLAEGYSLPEKLTTKIFRDTKQSAKTLRIIERGLDTKGVAPEWLKAAEMFQKFGGQTSYMNLRDMEKMKKHIIDTFKDTEKDGLINIAKDKLKAADKFMEDYSTVAENMFRLAAFKNISENYIAQGMNENTANELAANAALNLTVNFTKRGANAPLFSPLFMFANASIQANKRMWDAMVKGDKDKPFLKKRQVQIAMSLATAPIMLGMMGSLIGGEDDDGIPYYEKIPNYIRNNNIVLMIPGTEGKYISIPVGAGMNIFTTTGNMLYSMAQDVNPVSPTKAAFEVLKSSFNNFSPMGGTDEGWTAFVPTVARPFAQIAVNQKFTGSPIRPEGSAFQKGEYPDSQKYWSSTSTMAIGIAQWLNNVTGGSAVRSGWIDVSPTSIQHLFESYTGGTGKFVSRTMNLPLNLARGNEVLWSDVPVLRRFIGEQSYASTAPLYYELRTRVQTDQNEAKLLKENRDIAYSDRVEAYSRLAKGVSLGSVLKSTESALKKIRKQERFARGNLSGSALTRELEKLREAKLNIMKRLTRAAQLRRY